MTAWQIFAQNGFFLIINHIKYQNIMKISEKKILECQLREQQSKVLNAEASLLSAKEKLEINKMILRNLKAQLRALPESN